MTDDLPGTMPDPDRSGAMSGAGPHPRRRKVIMTGSSTEGPTVVLIHGAFADGSSWTGVIDLLLKERVKVQALAIGLRGIGVDSAYAASAISQIPGPVL